jgi:hypothetical protein
VASDELVRIIEDALFENRDRMAAASAAAEQLRAVGYRRAEDGPIEANFRDALDGQTDSALTRARREVVFAAARVMDNPKAVAFFKSAADVLRATVTDLLAAEPAKDGEADALNALVATFGPRGRSRGGAPMDDAEAPK